MEHVELNNDVETPIAGSGTNTFAKKDYRKNTRTIGEERLKADVLHIYLCSFF